MFLEGDDWFNQQFGFGGLKSKRLGGELRSDDMYKDSLKRGIPYSKYPKHGIYQTPTNFPRQKKGFSVTHNRARQYHNFKSMDFDYDFLESQFLKTNLYGIKSCKNMKIYLKTNRGNGNLSELTHSRQVKFMTSLKNILQLHRVNSLNVNFSSIHTLSTRSHLSFLKPVFCSRNLDRIELKFAPSQEYDHVYRLFDRVIRFMTCTHLSLDLQRISISYLDTQVKPLGRIPGWSRLKSFKLSYNLNSDYLIDAFSWLWIALSQNSKKLEVLHTKISSFSFCVTSKEIDALCLLLETPSLRNVGFFIRECDFKVQESFKLIVDKLTLLPQLDRVSMILGVLAQVRFPTVNYYFQQMTKVKSLKHFEFKMENKSQEYYYAIKKIGQSLALFSELEAVNISLKGPFDKNSLDEYFKINRDILLKSKIRDLYYKGDAFDKDDFSLFPNSIFNQEFRKKITNSNEMIDELQIIHSNESNQFWKLYSNEINEHINPENPLKIELYSDNPNYTSEGIVEFCNNLNVSDLELKLLNDESKSSRRYGDYDNDDFNYNYYKSKRRQGWGGNWEVADDQPGLLSGFKNLNSLKLNIQNVNFSAKKLVYIGCMKNLKKLEIKTNEFGLQSINISDFIAFLNELDELESIYLDIPSLSKIQPSAIGEIEPMLASKDTLKEVTYGYSTQNLIKVEEVVSFFTSSQFIERLTIIAPKAQFITTPEDLIKGSQVAANIPNLKYFCLKGGEKELAVNTQVIQEYSQEAQKIFARKDIEFEFRYQFTELVVQPKPKSSSVFTNSSIVNTTATLDQFSNRQNVGIKQPRETGSFMLFNNNLNKGEDKNQLQPKTKESEGKPNFLKNTETSGANIFTQNKETSSSKKGFSMGDQPDNFGRSAFSSNISQIEPTKKVQFSSGVSSSGVGGVFGSKIKQTAIPSSGFTPLPQMGSQVKETMVDEPVIETFAAPPMEKIKQPSITPAQNIPVKTGSNQLFQNTFNTHGTSNQGSSNSLFNTSNQSQNTIKQSSNIFNNSAYQGGSSKKGGGGNFSHFKGSKL